MTRHFASTTGPGRVRAAAMAALLLVVGLFAASAATPSQAAPPQTTISPTLTVTVSTDNRALTGAPGEALPSVLAAKGSATLDVTITVEGGIELTKGTAITLSPVVDPVLDPDRKPAGSFLPGSLKVPSKGSSWTFHEVKYTAADAHVAMVATVKKTPDITGQSAFFDIVDSLDFAFAPEGDNANDDVELRTGFGATECKANSPAQVCGIVVLPQGIASKAAALSSGMCDDAQCTGAEEVQFIAGLADRYMSPAAPATLILRCDKATCKGKGVTSYTAKITLLSSEADAAADQRGFIDSPACTTKGALNVYDLSTDQRNHFCTDYVASHRDNAGDLLMVILFDKDMRGTM